MKTSLRALICVAPVLAGSLPAHADWSFGGGRAAGMGGAGLAVPYDRINAGRLNPAIYGLGGSDFQLRSPNFDLRLQGIGIGDLRSYLSSANNGGLSSDNLFKLARNFGGHPVEFGFGTGLGLYSGGLAIEFTGSTNVTSIPNAALSNYVNGLNGAPVTNVPANGRLDGYGVAGYELTFAYGYRMAAKTNSGITLGARAKFVTNYYAHQLVDGASINANGSSTLAPEMGGKNSLSQNGFGLDIGAIWSDRTTQGLFFGATIDNLIVPQTTFAATLPNGLAGSSTVRPYYRQLNIGTGYMTKNNFVIAADLIDVTNSGSGQQLRAGFELNAGGGYALRGGYISGNGFTIGFGIAGINFAYSQSTPLLLTTAFRF